MQYTLLFGEAGSQPLRLAHKEVMSMTHFLAKATVVSAGLAAAGGKARTRLRKGGNKERRGA